MLESLFDKVDRFIKKRLQDRYFHAKFAKFLRTSILKNICERVLSILINVYEFFKFSSRGSISQNGILQ